MGDVSSIDSRLEVGILRLKARGWGRKPNSMTGLSCWHNALFGGVEKPVALRMWPELAPQSQA